MKKKTNAIAAVVIAFSILFSGVVLAADRGESEPRGFGPPSGDGYGHHLKRSPMHSGHLLGKALHDNMALDVLIELTGNEAATVQAAMDGRHMREVLSSYGIEEEVFRKAMDSETKNLLNQAIECGLITKEQASDILESVGSREQQRRRGTWRD